MNAVTLLGGPTYVIGSNRVYSVNWDIWFADPDPATNDAFEVNSIPHFLRKKKKKNGGLFFF